MLPLARVHANMYLISHLGRKHFLWLSGSLGIQPLRMTGVTLQSHVHCKDIHAHTQVHVSHTCSHSPVSTVHLRAGVYLRIADVTSPYSRRDCISLYHFIADVTISTYSGRDPHVSHTCSRSPVCTRTCTCARTHIPQVTGLSNLSTKRS